MNEFGKIPPQNIEAESYLLGSIIMESTAFLNINELITDEDFYKQENQVIFRAISDLFCADKKIDLLTIKSKIKNDNNLELIGGSMYLVDLTKDVISTGNIQEYALIIKDCAIRRNIIRKSSELYDVGYNTNIDLNDIINQLQSFNETIINQLNNKLSTFDLKSFILQSIKQYDYREELNKSGQYPGIPATLADYNEYCGGHLPGDLIIIAGRPSMGKTAFALSDARRASENGFYCLFFSLEMTGVKLSDRLILAKSGIDSEKFRLGRLSNQEKFNMQKAAEELKELNMYIDDKPYCSFNYIKTKSKQYKLKSKCDIIFIDYLQLTDMQGEQNRNREQEVSTMSRRMKALAKELDVPVVLISQLNRSAEDRRDFKPKLSDLRESGAIEQDADVVMFPFRPDYYGLFDQVAGDLKGKGVLIVAKHRHAGARELKFKYNETITEFTDYPRPSDPVLKLNPKKELDEIPF